MSSETVQAKMQSRMARAQEMREEEKIFRYKGVLYPTIMSPLENLKAMEDLEAREDDVMLAAYPKCGFNWMVGVLRKIIDASTGEKRDSKMPPLIEFFDPGMQQHLSQVPSPRFLGTHMHPDNIPPSFIAKKTKTLVIFRNPKDTAVSFYHFSTKNPVLPTPESWDKFYTEFMSGDVPWGSYFDHALAWEKRMDDPNVMIVTYEELKEVILTHYIKLHLFGRRFYPEQRTISAHQMSLEQLRNRSDKDLCKGVQQISQFFSFDLSEEQVQAIAQESTFDAMKDSSKDSHGPLSNVFFRKGVVGDWKNHFSEAQSEAMDAEFEKHLAGTKIGAQMKYELYCK